MNALAKLLGRATEPLEPLTDGPLLAECGPGTEAPRPWYGLPHCEDCQIARTHPSTCLCGHCATAGQHVADRMLADRLGALGLGWY